MLQVGDYNNAYRVLEEVNFPPELIFNAHKERVLAYVDARRARLHT